MSYLINLSLTSYVPILRNNPTAFSKFTNWQLQIEQNMVSDWVAWSPLWGWPCLNYLFGFRSVSVRPSAPPYWIRWQLWVCPAYQFRRPLNRHVLFRRWTKPPPGLFLLANLVGLQCEDQWIQTQLDDWEPSTSPQHYAACTQNRNVENCSILFYSKLFLYCFRLTISCLPYWFAAVVVPNEVQ